MERLEIDKRRDTIIIEKLEGSTISKGSKFYCGCCGDVLGESNKQINFPFSVETFKNSLDNKSFTTNSFGLRHKTCGHTMFGFKKRYGFTSLETYIENVPQLV